ncbi:hypothetical protein DH2020_003781 [Rehmannia glutinosa]|uniref:Microtubule-associated protein n=1 Tax=Rehmannia glutinosa TaxID=99300 RepID=A0ABR0XMS1_REHGL
MAGTLKEQLNSITPALSEMQLRKEERVKQFGVVQGQIHKISAEIAGRTEYNDTSSAVRVNENDLSLKKLEEYQNELQRLHSEKLDSTVKSLESEKQMRLDKLQQLGKALSNLWNLMDTPYEDRQQFRHVTSLSSVASAEISRPGSLTLDIVQQAETEVKRLDQLKASKMKEFFYKKQIELEEICSRSHMEIPSRLGMENLINQINTGEIDHADLLTSMDEQISIAEEEAASRKVIMEKVEKWILARDEERWLEEYSRDENRYSVSRGAHKNLKRAERARVMVNKIPAWVDLLISKTKYWEDERKKVFLYDEEHKKAQSKVVTEHESPFGPRPGTSSRRLSDKSFNGGFRIETPSNRKLSMGLEQTGSNSIGSPARSISSIQGRKKANGQRIYTQKGFAYHLREDTVSVVSSFSGPFSP